MPFGWFNRAAGTAEDEEKTAANTTNTTNTTTTPQDSEDEKGLISSELDSGLGGFGTVDDLEEDGGDPRDAMAAAFEAEGFFSDEEDDEEEEEEEDMNDEDYDENEDYDEDDVQSQQTFDDMQSISTAGTGAVGAKSLFDEDAYSVQDSLAETIDSYDPDTQKDKWRAKRAANFLQDDGDAESSSPFQQALASVDEMEDDDWSGSGSESGSGSGSESGSDSSDQAAIDEEGEEEASIDEADDPLADIFDSTSPPSPSKQQDFSNSFVSANTSSSSPRKQQLQEDFSNSFVSAVASPVKASLSAATDDDFDNSFVATSSLIASSQHLDDDGDNRHGNILQNSFVSQTSLTASASALSSPNKEHMQNSFSMPLTAFENTTEQALQEQQESTFDTSFVDSSNNPFAAVSNPNSQNSAVDSENDDEEEVNGCSEQASLSSFQQRKEQQDISADFDDDDDNDSDGGVDQHDEDSYRSDSLSADGSASSCSVKSDGSGSASASPRGTRSDMDEKDVLDTCSLDEEQEETQKNNDNENSFNAAAHSENEVGASLGDTGSQQSYRSNDDDDDASSIGCSRSQTDPSDQDDDASFNENSQSYRSDNEDASLDDGSRSYRSQSHRSGEDDASVDDSRSRSYHSDDVDAASLDDSRSRSYRSDQEDAASLDEGSRSCHSRSNHSDGLDASLDDNRSQSYCSDEDDAASLDEGSQSCRSRSNRSDDVDAASLDDRRSQSYRSDEDGASLDERSQSYHSPSNHSDDVDAASLDDSRSRSYHSDQEDAASRDEGSRSCHSRSYHSDGLDASLDDNRSRSYRSDEDDADSLDEGSRSCHSRSNHSDGLDASLDDNRSQSYRSDEDGASLDEGSRSYHSRSNRSESVEASLDDSRSRSYHSEEDDAALDERSQSCHSRSNHSGEDGASLDGRSRSYRSYEDKASLDEGSQSYRSHSIRFDEDGSSLDSRSQSYRFDGKDDRKEPYRSDEDDVALDDRSLSYRSDDDDASIDSQQKYPEEKDEDCSYPRSEDSRSQISVEASRDRSNRDSLDEDVIRGLDADASDASFIQPNDGMPCSSVDESVTPSPVPQLNAFGQETSVAENPRLGEKDDSSSPSESSNHLQHSHEESQRSCNSQDADKATAAIPTSEEGNHPVPRLDAPANEDDEAGSHEDPSSQIGDDAVADPIETANAIGKDKPEAEEPSQSRGFFGGFFTRKSSSVGEVQTESEPVIESAPSLQPEACSAETQASPDYAALKHSEGKNEDPSQSSEGDEVADPIDVGGSSENIQPEPEESSHSRSFFGGFFARKSSSVAEDKTESAEVNENPPKPAVVTSILGDAEDSDEDPLEDALGKANDKGDLFAACFDEGDASNENDASSKEEDGSSHQEVAQYSSHSHSEPDGHSSSEESVVKSLCENPADVVDPIEPVSANKDDRPGEPDQEETSDNKGFFGGLLARKSSSVVEDKNDSEEVKENADEPTMNTVVFDNAGNSEIKPLDNSFGVADDAPDDVDQATDERNDSTFNTQSNEMDQEEFSVASDGGSECISDDSRHEDTKGAEGIAEPIEGVSSDKEDHYDGTNKDDTSRSKGFFGGFFARKTSSVLDDETESEEAKESLEKSTADILVPVDVEDCAGDLMDHTSKEPGSTDDHFAASFGYDESSASIQGGGGSHIDPSYSSSDHGQPTANDEVSSHSKSEPDVSVGSLDESETDSVGVREMDDSFVSSFHSDGSGSCLGSDRSYSRSSHSSSGHSVPPVDENALSGKIDELNDSSFSLDESDNNESDNTAEGENNSRHSIECFGNGQFNTDDEEPNSTDSPDRTDHSLRSQDRSPSGHSQSSRGSTFAPRGTMGSSQASFCCEKNELSNSHNPLRENKSQVSFESGECGGDGTGNKNAEMVDAESTVFLFEQESNSVGSVRSHSSLLEEGNDFKAASSLHEEGSQNSQRRNDLHHNTLTFSFDERSVSGSLSWGGSVDNRSDFSHSSHSHNASAGDVSLEASVVSDANDLSNKSQHNAPSDNNSQVSFNSSGVRTDSNEGPQSTVGVSESDHLDEDESTAISVAGQDNLSTSHSSSYSEKIPPINEDESSYDSDEDTNLQSAEAEAHVTNERSLKASQYSDSSRPDDVDQPSQDPMKVDGDTDEDHRTSSKDAEETGEEKMKETSKSGHLGGLFSRSHSKADEEPNFVQNTSEGSEPDAVAKMATDESLEESSGSHGDGLGDVVADTLNDTSDEIRSNKDTSMEESEFDKNADASSADPQKPIVTDVDNTTSTKIDPIANTNTTVANVTTQEPKPEVAAQEQEQPQSRGFFGGLFGRRRQLDPEPKKENTVVQANTAVLNENEGDSSHDVNEVCSPRSSGILVEPEKDPSTSTSIAGEKTIDVSSHDSVEDSEDEPVLDSAIQNEDAAGFDDFDFDDLSSDGSASNGSDDLKQSDLARKLRKAGMDFLGEGSIASSIHSSSIAPVTSTCSEFATGSLAESGSRSSSPETLLNSVDSKELHGGELGNDGEEEGLDDPSHNEEATTSCDTVNSMEAETILSAVDNETSSVASSRTSTCKDGQVILDDDFASQKDAEAVSINEDDGDEASSIQSGKSDPEFESGGKDSSHPGEYDTEDGDSDINESSYYSGSDESEYESEEESEEEFEDGEGKPYKLVVKEAPLLRLENVTAKTRSGIPESPRKKKGGWGWFGFGGKEGPTSPSPVKKPGESESNKHGIEADGPSFTAGDPSSTATNPAEKPKDSSDISAMQAPNLDGDDAGTAADDEGPTESVKSEMTGAKAKADGLSGSSRHSTSSRSGRKGRTSRNSSRHSKDGSVHSKNKSSVSNKGKKDSAKQMARKNSSESSRSRDSSQSAPVSNEKPSSTSLTPVSPAPQKKPNAMETPQTPSQRSVCSSQSEYSSFSPSKQSSSKRRKKKSRSKKAGLSSHLGKAKIRKVGRHGDEVSVGTTTIQKRSGDANHVILAPPTQMFDDMEYDDKKRRPWEEKLPKKTAKNTSDHFASSKLGIFGPVEEYGEDESGCILDELESLKSSEHLFDENFKPGNTNILGSADESDDDEVSFGGETASIDRDRADSSDDDAVVGGEEDKDDDLAKLMALSAMESQMEASAEEIDFDDMWDNVSCDASTALEFERKKRSKTRERERKKKKRDKGKEEKERSQRLRLFEKATKEAKRRNKGKSKLSTEFVSAINTVFDDKTVSPFGEESDDEEGVVFALPNGALVRTGSVKSLYTQAAREVQRKVSDGSSQGSNSINDSGSESESDNEDSDSDNEDGNSASYNSRSGNSKSSRRSRNSYLSTRSRKAKMDPAAVFEAEMKRAQQSKVLSVSSLRQEMTDRRGTSVHLIQREYETYKQQRSQADHLQNLSFANGADAQFDTLQFGASDEGFFGTGVSASKLNHSENGEDCDLDRTENSGDVVGGLGAHMSRWASEEDVTALDDLMTVQQSPRHGVTSHNRQQPLTPEFAPTINTLGRPGLSRFASLQMGGGNNNNKNAMEPSSSPNKSPMKSGVPATPRSKSPRKAMAKTPRTPASTTPQATAMMSLPTLSDLAGNGGVGGGGSNAGDDDDVSFPAFHDNLMPMTTITESDDDDDNVKLFTGTTTCDDHDEDYEVSPRKQRNGVRFAKTPSMKMPKMGLGRKMKKFVPKRGKRAPSGGAKMGLLGDSDW